LKADGQGLVSEVFSVERPLLVFSDLESESGRNDQKGFLQILTGAYIGIRNPKAHSLRHDLDKKTAAQYMIFASLLARRVTEARAP
ncbi:MAG: TIGR02391 family protein, partial [Gammaproteobacteria bacterium]|nr:TIGR02391 family protein [Gammaproteobacteria bacterium]